MDSVTLPVDLLRTPHCPFLLNESSNPSLDKFGGVGKIVQCSRTSLKMLSVPAGKDGYTRRKKREYSSRIGSAGISSQRDD
ncbi:uncharacterized protein JCM6883_002933 [Sporobolomyces salmoneus]|uniref:uncharacterized protein n=1 Tax=Sporobolomyces salmoneus TaxID=183962 RepID=UPI00316C62D1